MKKGGNFFWYLVIIFTSLVFGDQAFGYDTNIAHPGIAGLAVKVYNKNNIKKITAEQYEWIRQGAVDEDNPTRWLNHFYDPVYNRGLWFFTQHDSSKVWAKNAVGQQSYSLGDFTWQRAINDYRRGNMEAAFKGLGHNIHLVSDLFVPAHTRDDIHAPKPDSYEDFVKQNWMGIAPSVSSVSPIYKSSIDTIFDEAANFSNNNFYSDETIESKDYKIKKILNVKEIRVDSITKYIAQTEVGGSFYNLLASNILDWKNGEKIVSDVNILSDYSSQLLPKAVGYSAGMVALFLDEVEKNQTEKSPYFKENISGYINSAFGLAISSAEKIYQSNSSNAAQNNSTINSAVDSLVKDIENIGKTVVNKTPVEPIVSTPISNNPNSSGSIIKVVGDNPYGYGFGSTKKDTTANTSSDSAGSPSSTVTDLEENTPAVPIPTSTPSPTSTTSTSPTTTTTTDTDDSLEGQDPEVEDSGSNTGNPPTTTDPNNIGSGGTTTSTTSTDPNTDEDPPLEADPENEPSTPTEPVADVVINEIAWAGTSALTTADQYIELYNNTDQPIKLFSNDADSWQIKINDQKISILSIKNSTIPAKGFYLLERKDDNAVVEIAADVIYNSALSNNGNKIELFSPASSSSVDFIDAVSGWPAGSAVTFASMERINTKISGNSTTNWQNNQGPRLEGKVRNGGSNVPLNGSPKQSNFGSILLVGTQLADNLVLSSKAYPYILQDYVVPVGKTLTIKPGVKILGFANYSRLDIYGELNAVGSTDQKIVFSSYQTSPKEKDWRGLVLRPGSKANISDAEIKYAGKEYFLNGYIWTQPVTRVIFADHSELSLSNVDFNNSGPSTYVFLDSASSSIKDSNFYNGGRAIENYGGFLSLENNHFENFSNTEAAVYIKGIWPEMKDLEFLGNAANHIFLYDVEINNNLEIKSNIPMVWSFVTVAENTTVNVEAGAHIMIPILCDINIRGNLNLNGLADNPINITTIGALNNNHWGRIIVDGGHAFFNNTNVRGGTGVFRIADNLRGMIVVKSGKLDIEGTQILDGRQSGNDIQIIGGEVKIKDSAIGYLASKPAGNNNIGIRMDGGSLSLDNTTFLNLDWALYSDNHYEDLPPLNFNNMSPQNFQSIGTPWYPSFWLFEPVIWVGSTLPPL